MAADDIRAMSEALAAEPGSLVFLPLAEALLARGDLETAARVAQRGAARHNSRAAAHDLVARIALARGDVDVAEVSWETVLTLDPGFGTAHRGLGLLRYRQGRFEEARHHLEAARADDPSDEGVAAALDAVRGALGEPTSGPSAAAAAAEAAAPRPAEAPVPAPSAPSAPSAPHDAEQDPGELFDELLGDTAQVALLLDADGFVTAGHYRTADGGDLGATIGAHLSGVSDEADRAMRHLGLGRWTRIVLESEAATVAMAPEGDALVLLAAPHGTPLGFTRRTLDRCVAIARRWLGGAA
jgi:tetratricopeptide (TPR) repeat protein